MTSRASRDQKSTHPFSPRILASAIVIALASLSANVDAAGLGRLNVQSGLGQPLRAEVEVTSLTPQEAQSLSAKLAPQEAFRQAGLEYNPALQGLRFAIEPRGGRTFVKITSTQPINEPFVDLLVELNWATGKFVREYTFLLDPPELRTAQAGESTPPQQAAAPAPAAPAAAPAPAAPVAAAPAPAPRIETPRVEAPRVETPRTEPTRAETPRPDAPTPAQRPARAARAEAAPAVSGGVDVKRGDTLAGIARAAKPEGVSLDQAMIAIYRANRSAFIADNINLVREGAKLAIPDAASMSAIDAAEAGREVKLQSTNFNQYRQKLAGNARAIDDPRSGQTAAGSVGGRVTDRSGEAGGDQLRLSKPGSAGASGAAVGSQSSRASGEDEVARRNALREANSRITDLEKNVTDLQKLLELKNKSMADLQKQLDEARSQSKAVTGQVAPPPSAKAEPPKAEAPKPIDPPKAPEPPKVEPPKAAEPAKVEPPKPAEPPVAEAPKVEPPPPVAAPPKPVVKPPVVVEAPVETSLVDDLLENPFLLPGLGGLALLGAGYGWYAMRRRRKVEKFEDSLIAADAFTANSLFGSTGGQSVDTSQSVFSTSVANGAVDVHSTEVDPIAEADVYIAYGREAQAEEILKEALKRQPERQAIRAKLLEIYSGRKDARAFEALAREMHEMTDGRNEEWPKVATMGLSLDPNNPLYGGGAADESPSPGAIAAGAAAVAAASASAAASARVDLDFPETPAARTPEPALGAAEDDIPSLDFDLNLDTRIDRAADDAVSDTVSGPDYSAGSPADLGASLDERFDLPSLDLDPKGGSKQSDALDLDLPALEGLTQTGASQADAGLDLSPISLDLEPATVAADEGEALSGGAGRWQEMATKLDLASAYEEIGDKEGARELLQEVIKGGDSGQQQKARAMLSKIG